MSIEHSRAAAETPDLHTKTDTNLIDPIFQSEIHTRIYKRQDPDIQHIDFPELEALRVASCVDLKDVKRFRKTKPSPPLVGLREGMEDAKAGSIHLKKMFEKDKEHSDRQTAPKQKPKRKRIMSK